MHRIASAVAAAAVVVASLLASSGHAYAHETRTVGPYEIEVGWTQEPAFAGVPNGIYMHAVDTRTSTPVEGLAKTLAADVAAGGLAAFAIRLEPVEGEPGTYHGSFVPTKTGGYTFHLRGRIGTLDVDEKFESGPNTFDDVQDISVAQYPTKVPAAEALAARLDQARSAAEQARLVGAIGALLGLAGLIVGAVALTRSRA